MVPPGESIHELGTCRMGADPKTSVLNEFNQSHDVKNLFVIDGSAFVLRRLAESDADDPGPFHAGGRVHGGADAEEQHLRRYFFLLLIASALFGAVDPPEQPIPYSHKKHLAMGLKCANCHEMPDPGEMMGIPAATKCMSCHASVKKDSPAIQKLAGLRQEWRGDSVGARLPDTELRRFQPQSASGSRSYL